MYSGEYDACDVTLSVYPHRASLKNMPDTVGIEPTTFGILVHIYLESVILCPYSILITGDFNVHVDDPSNDDALRFLDLLESLGLEQHID